MKIKEVKKAMKFPLVMKVEVMQKTEKKQEIKHLPGNKETEEETFETSAQRILLYLMEND